MRVQKIPPEPKTTALFPRAAFADAYRLIVDEPALDAIMATRRVVGRAPRWISMLLSLRNRIAAPLGLKAARHEALEEDDRIGVFPVISRAPERVVLGLDDKHLDFLFVVEALEIDARRSQITATTLVRPHNLLGRTYLAFVLPFHRIIVPAILAQAART